VDAKEQQLMAEALDRMWAKFLPQLTERVDVLETAATALSAGRLTLEQRSAAHAAAHKLAGVLGTFSLTKGTVLAREAEILYSAEPENDAAAPVRLTDIARQLRVLIEQHK